MRECGELGRASSTVLKPRPVDAPFRPRRAALGIDQNCSSGRSASLHRIRHVTGWHSDSSSRRATRASMCSTCMNARGELRVTWQRIGSGAHGLRSDILQHGRLEGHPTYLHPGIIRQIRLYMKVSAKTEQKMADRAHRHTQCLVCRRSRERMATRPQTGCSLSRRHQGSDDKLPRPHDLADKRD